MSEEVMTKILIDRATAEQALEALKEFGYHGSSPRWERTANALKNALEQQPVQEPVAWLYPEGLEALQAGKCWTAYPRSHEDCNIPLYTAPPQRQAEPVAWDKPSASFNEWWDGDYEDPANPFEKDSHGYWAWAGWQAAQRPWVGLTEEEIKNLELTSATSSDVRNISAELKEKNT